MDTPHNNWHESPLAVLTRQLAYMKTNTPCTVHVPVRKVSMLPLMSCKDCVFYNTVACDAVECNLNGKYLYVIDHEPSAI